jgi:hypothetical protein
MRLERLRSRLARPVDASSLVVFRIAFGLVMAWEAYRYLSKGWVQQHYVDPEFHFTYMFFGWVRPWPGEWMHVHFYALGALALLIAAGAAYRAAATLFFAGFTYVFLLERALYLNHFYLICLISFLMILVPAHRALSIDALLRPRLRRDTVPAWSVWLLRFQVGVPYFFGGIAKLDSDWLRGEPMRTWMADRTDFPVIGPLFTQDWVVYSASWFGLLLDLLVVPGLLWRRTRPVAYALAVAFHLMNAGLFEIGIFPWLMMAATTIFFEPDWPRRLLRRGPAAPTAAAGATPRLLSRAAFGALVLWCAVQVLAPLRHFLYPGPASWTEEGHMFSWHMKLRNKEGDIRFFIVHRETGARQRIHHDLGLTERQHAKMSTRPAMIQQFARHIDEELRARGYTQYEVRVEAFASLNGRPFQRLIDSTVDLAGEPARRVLPAPWIVPLHTPLDQRLAASTELEVD